mgnify:CR=1 FL=1
MARDYPAKRKKQVKAPTSLKREIIRDVLSPSEASLLSGHIGYGSFADPLIGRLSGLVTDRFPYLTLDAPSYCRVEDRREGYPWHVDVGNRGHMAWCRVSASCLLTPVEGFSGGGYYFRDEGPIFHYLDLLVYDDDAGNEHRVAPHHGDRRVLLMCFGAGDG